MQTDAHMDVSAHPPPLASILLFLSPPPPSPSFTPSFLPSSPFFPSFRSSCSSGTHYYWTCGG
jgi:hypothetical protein